MPLQAVPKPALGFVLASLPWDLGLVEALLCHLFSHCMSRFTGSMALTDKVTNLLAVHHEVNSIRSEDQEAVVSVMQLQSEPNSQD